MPKARILAVDDQRYFRELLAGMLAEEGFDAQTASSGEEALHILANNDFDVVLTDLVMPGMDGTELVHRIKQRDPEQQVVVVTGVVDVRTAVDAMKLGASDYLLKPFDRRTLSVTLEGILQASRLRTEHDRLLAENIEFIGEHSLYQRALGLFATLSLEPLAARMVESTCLETRAQGGVIWARSESGSDTLDLAAARGLVRVAEEPEAVQIADLPEGLREGARTCLAPWGGDAEQPPALYAALRRDGEVIGLLRLTDKLEGESFDAVDQACIEKLLHFGDVAFANALRVRALERRSFQDPLTGAYKFEYFQDVARIEIEKASRFGRSLALLEIDSGDLEAPRACLGKRGLPLWLAAMTDHLRKLLRATDLLAVDSRYRFFVLLPEADALGATVLKRRAVQALAGSQPMLELPPETRPRLRAGVAVYPGDGERLEVLLSTLDARVAEEARSRVSALGLERLSLAAALQALVRHGLPERPETAEQLVRFVLSEVGRRPRERGLLYAAPGQPLADALRQGLEGLRGVPTRTDLVVIADGERTDFDVPAVSWIASRRAPGLPPCLVHYGDGPAYALVREESHNGAPARLFHTDDRNLVEHLAFRLHETLALPPRLAYEVSS